MVIFRVCKVRIHTQICLTPKCGSVVCATLYSPWPVALQNLQNVWGDMLASEVQEPHREPAEVGKPPKPTFSGVEEQKLPRAYSSGVYVQPCSPSNTLAGISDSDLGARRGHVRGSHPVAPPPHFLVPVAKMVMLGHSSHSNVSCSTLSVAPTASLSLTTSLYPWLLPYLTIPRSPSLPVFPTSELGLQPSFSLMNSAQSSRPLLFPVVLPDHSRPLCFFTSSTLSALKAYTPHTAILPSSSFCFTFQKIKHYVLQKGIN